MAYEPEHARAFTRTLRGWVHKADDGAALNVLLQLERDLRDVIDARIAELRDDDRFSLRELARDAGIHPTQLQRRTQAGRITRQACHPTASRPT